jgi:hypothetical protein
MKWLEWVGGPTAGNKKCRPIKPLRRFSLRDIIWFSLSGGLYAGKKYIGKKSLTERG